MNMKQKLTYMLIGSLFTLAGYFLATLANNQPPNAHAQDNTTKVFDKIICKELEVVNKDGKTMVRLHNSVGGALIIYNPVGHEVASLSSIILGGHLNIQSVVDPEKEVSLSSIDGLVIDGLVDIIRGKDNGNALRFYNKDNNVVGGFTATEEGGAMAVFNSKGKLVAYIGVDENGYNGVMGINNKVGKELVGIGAIKDRPNDGIIAIYNFKGDHRSYTAD